MPRSATITGPDGRSATIGIPERASDDDARAAIDQVVVHMGERTPLPNATSTSTTATATSTPYGTGAGARQLAQQATHVAPLVGPDSDLPRMLGAVAGPAVMGGLGLTPAGPLAGFAALLASAGLGGGLGEALGPLFGTTSDESAPRRIGKAAVESVAGQALGSGIGLAAPQVLGQAARPLQAAARMIGKPGSASAGLAGYMLGGPGGGVAGLTIPALARMLSGSTATRAAEGLRRGVPATSTEVGIEAALEALLGQYLSGKPARP